ncbi:MAG: HDOD domain-containing protein [Nitrospinota bacterium]
MKLHYKLPAFEKLTENEVMSVYKIADIRKYAPNDIIIKDGDDDQTFFAILEGSVKVTKTTDGKTSRLATLMAGNWVGEIALVKNRPRMADVVASQPSVLMAIKPDDFKTLPGKIQLHIQKHLYDLTAKRVERLQGQNAEAIDKFAKISSYINSLRSKSDDCIASDLIQNIIGKIPKLPRYAGDLAIKLLDPHSSAIDVAESIKTDPSLSSLVLKTINSPYFGLADKISDLYRAFLLLGFNQVYQLVLDSGIKKTMPNTPEFHELQMHSYFVSIVATEVAAISGRKESGSASGTIGLLHDIGKSVVLILKKQNPSLKNLLDLLDYAKLGSVLLESWELPALVCKVIDAQDIPIFQNPESIPSSIRDELAILYIAHSCAERLMGSPADETPGIYMKEYMSHLNIRANNLEHLAYNRILPALEKNQKSYPESTRVIIKAAREL